MSITINKQDILHNLCYTELVYGRINKKLKTEYTKMEIENFILGILKSTDIKFFEKIGKNYYINSLEKGIRITINSNTCRIITVDRI